jgi:selenocysteine-specific elongation factor
MVSAGGWLMSADLAEQAATDLERLVREHDAADPLHPGVPVPELAERLGLPTPELVAPLVRPPLRGDAGRVIAVAAAAVPEPLAQSVEKLHQDLADAPWSAPTADRLAELRLDTKAVAALAKAGLLLRVAPGIVLLPDADDRARDALAELPQPFTASEARQRLGTSRRVVLPLLDHLDRTGRTRRLPDDRREVVPR